YKAPRLNEGRTFPPPGLTETAHISTRCSGCPAGLNSGICGGSTQDNSRSYHDPSYHALHAEGRCALRPPDPLLEPENRSEEHTSELQSRENLVCRLLLEKKKNK